MSPETHPARNVSPGVQRHPDWKPPAPGAPAPPASPYQWQPPPNPAPPKPPQPDLDGFEIGEALFFPPLHNMGRIVDLEKFEGIDGMTHRFVVEFQDDETEMRVPISKLRDLMSRKRKVYTDQTLDDLDDDEDGEPPKPKEPIMESNGFKVGEHVVYPQHGVGKILAIEAQEVAGATIEMFVINFKNDNMTLRVPTAKYQNVGMRRLADEI
jgi:RNA polymerase-interacting CarD/CdnL/TRCF family regulator